MRETLTKAEIVALRRDAGEAAGPLPEAFGKLRPADEIVTVQVTARIQWQGPASRAGEAGRF